MATRTWPPGGHHYDVVTRIRTTGRGRQNPATGRSPPWCGHQNTDPMTLKSGPGHREVTTMIWSPEHRPHDMDVRIRPTGGHHHDVVTRTRTPWRWSLDMSTRRSSPWCGHQNTDPMTLKSGHVHCPPGKAAVLQKCVSSESKIWWTNNFKPKILKYKMKAFQQQE